MDFHDQLADVSGDRAGGEDVDTSGRDPGSPLAARIALLIIIAVYGVILLGNMIPVEAPEPANAPVEWTAELRKAHFEQTRKDPLAIISRVFVYMKELTTLPEGFIEAQMPDVEDANDAELLQRAVMLGEFMGTEEALAALKEFDERVRDPLSEGEASDFIGEAGATEYLRRVYLGTLDEADLDQQLLDARDYLGWWAKLAGLHDADPDYPARVEMTENGKQLFWLFGVISIGGIFVALGAIAAFVYFAVRLYQRRIESRIVPPVVGGSVYLEVFAVFLCAFLLVKIFGDLVGATVGAQAGVYATMGGQWLLILVPLWPLVRGVPLSRLREDLGWHSGEGVLKEIGAGFVGYLAGLPLLAGGFVIVYAMQWVVLSATGEFVEPKTSVVDMVAVPSIIQIVLMISLAVIWAPLVEESVFRGALLRHVRGRVGIVLGALVTGLLFAFLHSYGMIFTPPLIALGFTFAMMRQWRGSLIAPMTAHFLHNATLMTIIMVGLRVVG